MKKFTNIFIGSVLVTMFFGVVFSSNIAQAAYRTYGNFIHLIGTTGRPSVVAGAGAGTGPIVSNNGTDMSGTVEVTAGVTPASNDVILTLTFSSAYASAPYCTFSPINTVTGALAGASGIYIATTITTLTFNSLVTGLVTGSVYDWNYVCAQ